MTDEQTTIGELKQRVLNFSRERDWEQFHHPNDLGLALACEVGEVLEHFRYRTHEEIRAALADPSMTRALGHELADCLWLLLRLADVCSIDLSTALGEKLVLAGQKYPIEKVYGRPDKYTHYRESGTDRADG